MKELNLKANTPSEQKILEYLQNNASETLAEKINNGTPFEKDGKPLLNKKTLADFMEYACDEARKTVKTAHLLRVSKIRSFTVGLFIISRKNQSKVLYILSTAKNISPP